MTTLCLEKNVLGQRASGWLDMSTYNHLSVKGENFLDIDIHAHIACEILWPNEWPDSCALN